MTQQTRVPSGTPAGGQFSVSNGTRATVDLHDASSGRQILTTDLVKPNADDPARFDVAIRFPETDHTSISQLATFRQCQLRWALSRHGIAEETPNEPTAAKKYADGAARRDRGLAFHAAAEAEIAGADPPEITGDVDKLLDGWHRSEPDIPAGARPEVQIRGRLVDDHTGELVEFLGYADRIDPLPDDTLRIVDYKTGSPPPDPDIAEGDDGVRRWDRHPDDSLTQADLQLLTYAAQLDNVSVIRTVYPTSTRTNGPLVIDRPVTEHNIRHAQAVTAHMLGRLSQARQRGAVTTSDGAGCSNCGYHRHCPQTHGHLPEELHP